MINKIFTRCVLFSLVFISSACTKTTSRSFSSGDNETFVQMKIQTAVAGALTANKVSLSNKTGGLDAAIQPGSSGTIRAIQLDVLRTEVHHELLGWFSLQNERRSFDLLKLTENVNEILGGQAITPGHYTQVRLILGNLNTVSVENNGTVSIYPLNIPSGQTTGIKLNHQFTVESYKHLQIYLDFDISTLRFIAGQNGYELRPTIAIDSVREFDAVSAIGPEGGSMTILDGNFTLVIPPGALPDTRWITISGIPDPLAPVSGQSITRITGAYDLNVQYGEQFLKPVTMIFRDSKIRSMTAEEKSGLNVYYFNPQSGLWDIIQSAPGDTPDEWKGTVSHFSIFSLFNLLGIKSPYYPIDAIPTGNLPSPIFINKTMNLALTKDIKVLSQNIWGLPDYLRIGHDKKTIHPGVVTWSNYMGQWIGCYSGWNTFDFIGVQEDWFYHGYFLEGLLSCLKPVTTSLVMPHAMDFDFIDPAGLFGINEFELIILASIMTGDFNVGDFAENLAYTLVSDVGISRLGDMVPTITGCLFLLEPSAVISCVLPILISEIVITLPKLANFLSDGLLTINGTPLTWVKTISVHIPWTSDNGFLSCEYDEIAQKGFIHERYSANLGGKWRSIDIYNIHMDAGDCSGDTTARSSQTTQLIAYVKALSLNNGIPFIIMGDFNMNSGKEPGTLNRFYTELSAIDTAPSFSSAYSANIIAGSPGMTPVFAGHHDHIMISTTGDMVNHFNFLSILDYAHFEFEDGSIYHPSDHGPVAAQLKLQYLPAGP